MERCGRGRACRSVWSWVRLLGVTWEVVELDSTSWGGDVGQWMVELGDGEVLGRSIELGGTGMSPEVNEEARRA